MKRLIGASLLLLLVFLAGCGSSSSPSTNRIQVTGTFFDDATNILTGSGTITVTPLLAGTKGLGQVADVQTATVNPTTGTVTLINIPANRKVVLKIALSGSSVYTWYVLDTSSNTFSIHPQEWAAGRLAFDLVRSYTDSRLDIDMFGTDYEQIYDAVYATVDNSQTISSWIATPASFYTYLQGKIASATGANTYLTDIIKRSTGSNAADGDHRKTLQSVTTDTEPSWPSEYTIHTELADTDVDNYLTIYDRYLVASSNLLNITTVKAVKRVRTISPNQVLVRVESRGSSQTSTSSLTLVVRDLALNQTPQTYTLSYQSSSGDARYYECVIDNTAPFINLQGTGDDAGYYLFQVVDPSAITWDASAYSTIDLDRTPCIFVRVPND